MQPVMKVKKTAMEKNKAGARNQSKKAKMVSMKSNRNRRCPSCSKRSDLCACAKQAPLLGNYNSIYLGKLFDI